MGCSKSKLIDIVQKSDMDKHVNTLSNVFVEIHDKINKLDKLNDRLDDIESKLAIGQLNEDDINHIKRLVQLMSKPQRPKSRDGSLVVEVKE